MSRASLPICPIYAFVQIMKTLGPETRPKYEANIGVVAREMFKIVTNQ